MAVSFIWGATYIAALDNKPVKNLGGALSALGVLFFGIALVALAYTDRIQRLVHYFKCLARFEAPDSSSSIHDLVRICISIYSPLKSKINHFRSLSRMTALGPITRRSNLSITTTTTMMTIMTTTTIKFLCHLLRDAAWSRKSPPPRPAKIAEHLADFNATPGCRRRSQELL
jgi:hypothetical protein